jgi:hypothetical protein
MDLVMTRSGCLILAIIQQLASPRSSLLEARRVFAEWQLNAILATKSSDDLTMSDYLRHRRVVLSKSFK